MGALPKQLRHPKPITPKNWGHDKPKKVAKYHGKFVIPCYTETSIVMLGNNRNDCRSTSKIALARPAYQRRV
jgi:hypothetical protein